ncbi:MAG: DUF433 domain-containing protein [Cyanobacteria bacterium P01_E01_bin.42]
MTALENPLLPIIPTERGLTIAGTRISLYEILDLLAANYTPLLIRDRLNLTDEQIHAALSYIEKHRDRLNAGYQKVLQTRQEIRQYWQERNRDHFSLIAETPQKSGQEALWAKLAEEKALRTSKITSPKP